MQKFKNLFEIINAMNRWQMKLKSPADLQKIFVNKTGFNILKVKNFTNLHAYPGIDKNGIFVFFIIPEDRDKPDHGKSIFKYIEPVPVITETYQHEPDKITDDEAKERIQNWQNNYVKWLQEIAKSEEGIYQAFRIPCEKKDSDRYTLSFALKKEKQTEGVHFFADLVIDINGGKFDTVRSVPPFDPSPLAGDANFGDGDIENTYYLLSFF
jgi:hypothetical protein